MPNMVVMQLGYEHYAVPIDKLQIIVAALKDVPRLARNSYDGPWYLYNGRHKSVIGEMTVAEVILEPLPPEPEAANDAAA